jgi:uncharacterized protein YndB with AHSA1/START domain
MNPATADADAIAANGVIRRTDDGYEIRFVRRLRKPIEKVWAALTVPERIADWFTDMRFVPEARLGARVELRFPDDDPPLEMTNGEVIAFEPPRLFAWTWPDADHPPGSVVRCELQPDGEGCILTFSESNRRATRHLVWGAAGWHVFLDGLEGATEGAASRWTMERELALRPHYQAQFDALVAPDGAVRMTGDGYELVFVRRLAKPIEKVWSALTVPERIADWLAPATIEPDLRLGARFNLNFGDGKHRTAGEIVALEPGRVLAWTWPASDEEKGPIPGVVTFELAPDGAGCVLTLTSRGPGRPHPGEAAGWHTHLEGLEGAADGVRTAWSADREKVHLHRYEAAVAAL